MAFNDKSYFNSLPLLQVDTPIIINNHTFTILDVKKKNKAFVFKLKNIENIDKAKEFIGSDIYIDSKYLPELDNNTFYEAELIGYKVIDLENNLYGEIVNIYSLPSNYVIEIKLKENGEIVSIPFVNAYFGEADKKIKSIKIIEKPIFYNE